MDARSCSNRPAGKGAATLEVWYYDCRTNIQHTLKKSRYISKNSAISSRATPTIGTSTPELGIRKKSPGPLAQIQEFPGGRWP